MTYVCISFALLKVLFELRHISYTREKGFFWVDGTPLGLIGERREDDPSPK